MSDIAIKVEGLSKRYKIGKLQRRHDTLRDRIADARVFNLFKRRNGGNGQSSMVHGPSSVPDSRLPTPDSETLWALKNVSFEVKRGEVVGIIGRNGAGKSTLLKILSRITEPTEGYADINGRVASLLEVGTGFHPELTGRENIYLNGSILGMKRAEINNKFDEIVAFAEVEKFIDTPVKYYSSGMYVRLAFAVAAHLEPEILLVDEVLAVGDIQFQKKCIGKMGEAAKAGRTVIVVSHNLTVIKALCEHGILLSPGLAVVSGTAEQVVRTYLNGGALVPSERIWPDPVAAPGDETARIHAVRILASNGNLASQTDIGEPLTVEIEYWALKDGIPLNVSFSVFNSDEVYVLASPSLSDIQWFGKPHPCGLFRSRCIIPGPFFNQGRYSVTALLVQTNRRHIIAQLDRVVSVDMVDLGEGKRDYHGYWGGVVRPQLNWNTVCLSTN